MLTVITIILVALFTINFVAFAYCDVKATRYYSRYKNNPDDRHIGTELKNYRYKALVFLGTSLIFVMCTAICK